MNERQRNYVDAVLAERERMDAVARHHCACVECECRNQREVGRPLCRLCRRGFHKPDRTAA